MPIQDSVMTKLNRKAGFTLGRTQQYVARRGMNGILDGDTGEASFDWGSLVDQIPATLVQLFQLGRQSDVQDQLLQLNIERAQRGLSPISLQQVGGAALASPQVNTNVSLDEGTKNMLMYGAAALAAVFIIPPLLKKRRR